MRPLVQIFLVTHLAILETVVAPFDALLAPARQASQTLLVAAETIPLYAEAAIDFPVFQPLGEAMLDDSSRGVADFIK